MSKSFCQHLDRAFISFLNHNIELVLNGAAYINEMVQYMVPNSATQWWNSSFNKNHCSLLLLHIHRSKSMAYNVRINNYIFYQTHLIFGFCGLLFHLYTFFSKCLTIIYKYNNLVKKALKL